MITKEKIKTEIDNLRDDYLEIVYRIIKALEMPTEEVDGQNNTINKQAEWHEFIRETYGSLSETPVERGVQGVFEAREALG